MEGAAEEDFEKLSIEERLQHKSWKGRLSAYTALITLFKSTVSEQDHEFRPYLNNPALVKDWVRDSNAVSQEKGVEAACALVEYAGKGAARTRSEVVPSVVEKCLGSARAGTKSKALELCLLYVQVEEDGGEGVISDLLPGLDLKQPKIVSGTVTVLKEIIRLFSPRTIPPKPILRVLPKIFSHADKTVRSEGTTLVLVLHSYLGDALLASLSELKPVQVKELEAGWARAEEDGSGMGVGMLKQSRWTVSQQRERDVKEAEGALEGNKEEAGEGGAAEEDEPEAPLDPYDLSDPVSILSSLPPDFYTHLSSAKWKDRKELALEPLLNLLKTPRLASGNYDELTRALAGRMTDANVLCVMLAANAIEGLAKGLRGEFKGYKANVMGPLLARTKEKKQNVLDAIAGALDAVFATITIGEITEDVTTYIKDKNPSVKTETLHFLHRSLLITPTPPPKSDITPLFEVLSKALEDSFEPVRLAAADALGTLWKCVGERAMGSMIDGLEELRRNKVKDAFEKAVVKCKVGGAGPTKTTQAPIAAVAKPKPKAPVGNKENAPLPELEVKPATKPPPARLMAKKPPVASTSSPTPPPASASPVKRPAPVAAKLPATAPPSKSAASEPLKYKFSQEDAEARAEEVLPPTIFNELGDANWKTRLNGITVLADWVVGEGREAESEVLVRFLSKKPGWKESNFQVAGKMFSIFQTLAEQSPTFSKAAMALSIPALSDKLGDMKLKKPAGDALTAYAEKSSLQFVLSQAYDPMIKQKAPKAQADSLAWVEQAIRDFGTVGVSIRDLIEFLKTGLKSTNAAVRTSATKTLVTLKLFLGVDISGFLQDLNPTLLTTIEGEFAKIASESAPAPTRVGADTAAPPAPSGGTGPSTTSGKGKAAATDDYDPLDDLFPRVDLEKLIASSSIAACSDANWKMRKEAMENIQAVLEAKKRFKPTPLSDLSSALKPRLADSNKIVQLLALDIVARLATGTGKPFDRLSRIFAGPTATVLADQKVNVRAAGVATLSAMADAAGLDPLVGGFDKPLDSANPLLRKELLIWLETRFADADAVSSLDLTSIAGPVLGCLEDKLAEVRKAATAILPVIVARAGYSYVMDQTSKLKPASRSTVVPLIEAARSSATASASSAPAPRGAVVPASRPTAAPAPSTTTAKMGLTRAPVGGKAIRPMSSVAPAPPAFEEAPSRTPAARPRPSMGGVRPKAPAAVPSRATPPPSSPAGREPPFRNADTQPKQLRLSKEMGSLRWAVEGLPRPDQVEALLQQMTPNTSSELLAQLFSKDHNAERDYAAALTLLDDCARDSGAASSYGLTPEDMRARLVANVDVIFKYITLRIGLTSTTITVKCLDLIDHLIPVMASEGYKLSENETTPLLLSLIAKVGDGKETIRLRVRGIFKAICGVYPFSKVFTTILENGLVSKNARARSESADELGNFFQRHGVAPFPVAKALPQIAKLISDRDAAVRTAALTAIGAAYSTLGAEAVYKAIGPMPAKEKTMLEERLKRTAGGSAPSSRSITPATRPTSPPQEEEMPPPRGLGLQHVSIPSPKSGISRIGGVGGPSRIGIGRPQSMMAPSAGPTAQAAAAAAAAAVASPRKPSLTGSSGLPLPRSIRPTSNSSTGARTASNPSEPEVPPANDLHSSTDLRTLIDSLITPDKDRCTNVLKQVQAEIDRDPEAIVPHADNLIEAIVEQMGVAFPNLNANTAQSVLRLCKHLMQTLSTFFDHKTLGQAVSPPALTMLLADLTGRLLDTAEETDSAAISSLSKVLNMVLIRIFHNSDQTACFSALFHVLQDATQDLRELRGTELTERAKYAELVMKCLWKVSKTVKDSLEANQLSAPFLLRDINQFLVTTPPAEWRRRSIDNIPLADMPLRTVKTILQQVVSVYGEQVFDHLEEIDSAENSFVYQYLFRLASNTGSNGTPAGSDPSRLSRQTSIVSMNMGRQESTSSIGTVSSLASAKPMGSLASPVLISSPTLMQRNGSGSMMEVAPPSSPGGADIDMNQKLKAIFDTIGDPVNSRAGIAELYEYQKIHPEAEARIATWMSGVGSYFRTYLKRALDNLASAERERDGVPFVEPETSHARSGSVSAASSPRPISSGPTTPNRPTSMYAPISPRPSRLSGGATGNGINGAQSTPGQAAKLQELQSMFGFSSQDHGRME